MAYRAKSCKTRIRFGCPRFFVFGIALFFARIRFGCPRFFDIAYRGELQDLLPELRVVRFGSSATCCHPTSRGAASGPESIISIPASSAAERPLRLESYSYVGVVAWRDFGIVHLNTFCGRFFHRIDQHYTVGNVAYW